MMKKLILCAALALSAFSANASCYGTAASRSCYDATSGNSYTVNRIGNSTYMMGSNATTGSTWTQSSSSFGGTTYINGTTNGRIWNETITPYSISGTNSRGQIFYYGR
ncbi:hypothetical protein EBZ37_04775 [bacterium]|jgi:hypothetical protein|nr:hypothetical protein [bacterium]